MMRSLDGIDALAVAFVEGQQKSGRWAQTDPDPISPADFITQEHMLYDGDSQDRTELRFRLLACEHPGLCDCADEYPNWEPGQR